MLVFDIETGPLSLDQLKKVCKPFDASTLKDPGEFDRESVKFGNIKDEAKIAAKVQEAAEKHAKAVADYQTALRDGEANHWKAIQDRAALSAITGEVLAIGYKNAEKVILDHVTEDRPESQLLKKFWDLFGNYRTSGRKMIGFNLEGFDVPFLVRRSLINKVVVPDCVLNGRYLDSTFVDLMKTWKNTDWKTDGSLDAICRACGIGKKLEGVDGSMFADLFRNDETRERALEYLRCDLLLTWGLAERFGYA